MKKTNTVTTYTPHQLEREGNTRFNTVQGIEFWFTGANNKVFVRLKNGIVATPRLSRFAGKHGVCFERKGVKIPRAAALALAETLRRQHKLWEVWKKEDALDQVARAFEKEFDAPGEQDDGS